MKKIILSYALVLIPFLSFTQQIRYSPAWYGPNAFPVPEHSDASIVSQTTLDITADYYFGFGDNTKNGYFRIEIPLLSEKVSFKVWSGFLEHFEISEELAKLRNIDPEREIIGKANSDVYVQTRIRLLKEDNFNPSLILNSTLKSSSGTKNLSRRYYNSSGYYFDIEAGKSISLRTKLVDELRVVGTLGFLCWETDNFTQNDAPMYGLKIKLKKEKIEWESGIRGYSGWMSNHSDYGSDYGDKPIVGYTKLSFQPNRVQYNIQYQYGIRDYPYHQIRLGIQFTSKKLTPQFK